MRLEVGGTASVALPVAGVDLGPRHRARCVPRAAAPSSATGGELFVDYPEG
ncbi:MAG TPA: hypothetical protein VIL48_10680 [Acidimicrobiales bacterium]